MFGQLRERWIARSSSARAAPVGGAAESQAPAHDSARERRPRAAAIGILAIGLLGTALYAYVLDQGYGMRFWLFWRLLGLWSRTAFFNLACASFGQFVVWRVLRMRTLAALETAVLAMAAGVVAFALSMYAAGALGWYNTSFAVVLPLAMLVIGARDAIPLARRLWLEWHAPEPRSLLQLLIGSAGVICVAIVYLGALSPDALNYDAGWSHQVIAQEYARNGRMVPFLADYNRDVPHLASLLYTWDYLVLGPNQPLRWMLALHTEFSLFVWTLLGVSAALCAMLDQPRLRRGWVGLFLFPAIFVYDSNLGGASDHVCGFFAVPIALATLRTCERFERGPAALFAIVAAGAVLTKLQALFLVTPALLVIAGHWLLRLWQLRRKWPQQSADPAGRAQLERCRRDLLWAPALIAGLGLLVYAPHPLRQQIFHNNPFYPFLQDVFTASRPTVPNAAFLVSHALADPLYQPQGTLWDKLLHAAKLFGTFSFVPHYSFTNDVPAFGSLFTLLLPCVLCFRRNRRLLLLAAVAAGAVLVWGMIYNVDRNLQVFMPVLAAVTTALIVSGWQLGAWARAGLVPLIGLQIVWSGDALFYSQHERIREGMDLIRTGYEGVAHKRFVRYRREFRDMNKVLPPDARVLLHAQHVSLGLQREVLLDGLGFQGLLSYAHLTTPRELHLYLRRFGITHLVEEPRGPSAPTAQEEVLWDAFTAVFAERLASFGGHQVMRLPDQPPPETPAYRVACLGLDSYQNGLYPVTALNTIRFLPEELRSYPPAERPLPRVVETWPAFFSAADALIIGRDYKVDPALKALLKGNYTIIRRLDEFNVFLKSSLLAGRS